MVNRFTSRYNKNNLSSYMCAMKFKSFANMTCSLAQSLEILGERWSLLILRDAFRGVMLIGRRKVSDHVVDDAWQDLNKSALCMARPS